MMKRTLSCLMLSLLLITIGANSPAVAWQESEAQADRNRQAGEIQNTNAAANQASPEKAPVLRPRPIERPPSSRIISRLGKLREELFEKLDLTPQQKKAIGDLFDDYIRSINEHEDQRSGRRVEDTDLAELRALRKQMDEARAAGNKERERELRQQLVDKAQSLRRPEGASTSELIQKTAQQLEDKQLGAFREIVKRFQLDEAHRSRGGPLRTILRAVRDPDLGLTDEQRRKVGEIVREQISAVPTSERRGDRMDKIAEAVRTEVFKLLTPEQKAKLEVRIKAAEQPDDTRPESGVTLKRQPSTESGTSGSAKQGDPETSENDKR